MKRKALGVTIGVALAMGIARADPPAYQYEALAYLGAGAPGGGTLQGAFKPGALGNEGEVAYVAGVGPGGAQGLFLDTIDGALAIAGPGLDTAQGWQLAAMPGDLGGIASPVSMNAAGDIVFAADLTRADQTGAGTFLWKPKTAALTALALPGQAAPGAAIFGNAGVRAGIADNGDVAFTAELPADGGGVGAGVFLLSQGRITPVARPGDPEPGGGTFVRASHPSVNDHGMVAFQADVSRGSQSATGIYVWNGSHAAVVAETGVQAPEGGVFRAAEEPRLNNSGDLAFFGDSGEWAAYLARGGLLTRLVGPGSLIPGGSRVGMVVAGEGSLALNQEGAVAMVLKPENSQAAGIFVYQRGVLWPVALPHSILAGIGPLDNVGPDLALNDQGQVAFQAELADGEVALVLASPLPSGG